MLWSVDLWESDIDTAQADPHVFGELAKHSDVTGCGNREFEQELFDLDALNVRQDRLVTTGRGMLPITVVGKSGSGLLMDMTPTVENPPRHFEPG